MGCPSFACIVKHVLLHLKDLSFPLFQGANLVEMLDHDALHLQQASLQHMAARYGCRKWLRATTAESSAIFLFSVCRVKNSPWFMLKLCLAAWCDCRNTVLRGQRKGGWGMTGDQAATASALSCHAALSVVQHGFLIWRAS